MSAPKKCIVCRSERKDEINNDMADNMSLRKLAAKYGYAIGSLQRHKNICLTRDFDALTKKYLEEEKKAKAQGRKIKYRIEKVREKQGDLANVASGMRLAERLVERINSVDEDADRIKKEAFEADNLAVANQALNTKLKAVAAYSSLAAEARERDKMKVDEIKSDWDALRKTLQVVLSHYPGALEELEGELSKQRSITFS